MVAHPHGVTFGQTVGESFAIVRAPGAAGVAVQNGNNVHTDWRGYAVVPSLTAYRKNVITPVSYTHLDVYKRQREQTDTSLLAINGGGAKGVAIKLYEHDQTTAVSLGKTTAKQTVTPGSSGGTGTADLEFYADYVSTAATVTAGKADGTANFNMIYN